MKKHVVDKVEGLFREWEKQFKNKENEAKRSLALQQKEKASKKDVANLFDAAHAYAIQLMIIEEDREFLELQRSQRRYAQEQCLHELLSLRLHVSFVFLCPVASFAARLLCS